MSFTLIDGEQRNADNPDTFEIPEIEDRLAVKKGDMVKLGFEVEGEDLGGERMWVEVSLVHEVLGEIDWFMGTIANDPIVIDRKFGDPVHFEPKNIISIWEE